MKKDVENVKKKRLKYSLVLRSHFWDKEKVARQDYWPLKKCSIMTGQEKGDLLIQVTA